ncbi:MAG: hypothetical protein ACK41D_08355 [Rubricoccaceae bacterium]
MSTTFRSVHHPGQTPRALVALQAQARPVAAALLAVFVVSLAAALRGHDVLAPVAVAVPAAYALGATFGMSSAARTPAELHVAGGTAALRSVWDAARGRPATFAPVLSARMVRGEVLLGLGDAIVVLRERDWGDDFEAVFVALVDAATACRLSAADEPLRSAPPA